MAFQILLVQSISLKLHNGGFYFYGGCGEIKSIGGRIRSILGRIKLIHGGDRELYRGSNCDFFHNMYEFMLID